jgi:two-component system chemotaxis sensor kinase CheA
MVATHSESGGGDFDLSQFYQIFFEEAGENLDLMEQMLLNLNLESADDEELNGIFRCAHSVKGGAATFGFSDVAELTHQMESLLDRLRRHELQPNSAMVDVLLESADASRGLLSRHQSGGVGEPLPTSDLVKRISALAAGQKVAREQAVERVVPVQAPESVVAAPRDADEGTVRRLDVLIGPLEHPARARLRNCFEIFRALERPSRCQVARQDMGCFLWKRPLLTRICSTYLHSMFPVRKS